MELAWNRDENTAEQDTSATAQGSNSGAEQGSCCGGAVGHQWGSRGAEPVQNLYRTGVES